MIFPDIYRPQDLSMEIVKDHLSSIREEILTLEKKDREKAVDFYNNEQNTSEYLGKFGFQNNEIPLQTINITEKIINKISLLYKNPPDRNNEIYQEWAGNNKAFNESLKTAERYKNLLKCVLYRPWYIPDVGWRFFIDHEFTPHFHEMDVLNPIAYTIPIKHDVTEVNKTLIEEDWHMFVSDKLFFWFSMGSKKEFRYFDDWAPDGEHNLGINPVVLMRKKFPVDQFRDPPAMDLIESNQSININLNNLNLAIHLQAFDQPYAVGANADQSKLIKLGPNEMPTFSDPEADLRLLGYNPKLTEMYESIKFQFEAIHRAYNVSVDWSMNGDVSSGFALVVKNIDLLEAREDDIGGAVAIEQNIYDVIRAQQESFNIPDEVKFKDEVLQVAFEEINFPVNESEERDKFDWEIKNNITNPLKYIMSKYGVDEDTARKEWEDNKIINEELSPRQKEINAVFDEPTDDNQQ